MVRTVGAVTEREAEVLLAVAHADDNATAAKALGIGETAVRNRTAKIRRKLGVKTNMQALMKLVGGVRFVENHEVTVRLEKL